VAHAALVSPCGGCILQCNQVFFCQFIYFLLYVLPFPAHLDSMVTRCTLERTIHNAQQIMGRWKLLSCWSEGLLKSQSNWKAHSPDSRGMEVRKLTPAFQIIIGYNLNEMKEWLEKCRKKKRKRYIEKVMTIYNGKRSELSS
jgi:hypothetical protein